jgi:hypothetical protein
VIHPDDSTEQLDLYLDQQSRGPRHPFALNGISPESTRAAQAFHALDAADLTADPRPGFVAHLKEQLDMTDPSAVFSERSPAWRAPLANDQRFQRPRPVLPSISHRFPAIRFANAFATAALLVVIVLGAYLALLAPRGGGGGAPTVPAVAPNASPSPGSAQSLQCSATDPNYGCTNLMRPVGRTHIWPPNLSDAALEASQVQLQGWAVLPGATITGVDAGDQANGVVVDIVLSGAYVATFNVPVVVASGGVTNDAIQYPEPGTTVELGRGDSVTYQLGGLIEINNPLTVQRLEFKRVVIFDGYVGAFSATSDGITTRLESAGTLPQTLRAYGEYADVELWYFEELNGSEFPPPEWETSLVIGPVDPQRGPDGTEGFVLVIGKLSAG